MGGLICDTPRAAALVYSGLGWSVLPTQRDKRPHGAALAASSGSSAWKRLRNEPASEDEIQEWYERYPDAGVGILTGPPSGLVVIDFDGPLPPGTRLTETPLVKTGRGLHLYLHSDDALTGRRILGGDLKAQGGYVVAPPSSHPSGTPYQWLIAPEGLGTLLIPEAPLADMAQFEQRGRLKLRPSGEHEGKIGVDIYSYEPHPIGALYAGDQGDLAEWDRDSAFVEAARLLLRIPRGEIGQAFRCVLPGHQEKHSSASLFIEPRRQTVVYHDWHTDTWYTLTEVYAAQVSGRIRKLRGPEHARWKLRLLVELGFLGPASIAMPPLSVAAPASARAVYDGFELLVTCRGITEEDAPTPFTDTFGAAWCGLTPSEFRKGKRWLVEHKVIQSAGWFGRMRLWRPGESEAA